MELPNLDKAIVSEQKLTKYLLAAAHEDGAGKANFFQLFGYDQKDWRELAAALLEHVREHGIVKMEGTAFGTRYVAEGPVLTADGRRPNLRSIWFIDLGRDVPRFVTAYPLERSDDH